MHGVYVYSEATLFADLERVGYRLVDRWDAPGRGFWLPGHPEKSFKSFSGLYLRAMSRSDAARRAT